MELRRVNRHANARWRLRPRLSRTAVAAVSAVRLALEHRAQDCQRQYCGGNAWRGHFIQWER
jgi:hypothetical protein